MCHGRIFSTPGGLRVPASPTHTRHLFFHLVFETGTCHDSDRPKATFVRSMAVLMWSATTWWPLAHRCASTTCTSSPVEAQLPVLARRLKSASHVPVERGPPLGPDAHPRDSLGATATRSPSNNPNSIQTPVRPPGRVVPSDCCCTPQKFTPSLD